MLSRDSNSSLALFIAKCTRTGEHIPTDVGKSLFQLAAFNVASTYVLHNLSCLQNFIKKTALCIIDNIKTEQQKEQKYDSTSQNNVGVLLTIQDSGQADMIYYPFTTIKKGI